MTGVSKRISRSLAAFFVFAWLLSAFALFGGTAAASEVPWEYRQWEWGRISSWLKDSQVFMRINADPVKRAIVCRVPFFNFTPEAMMRATNLTRERLMRAVRELEAMGLVRVVVENGREQVTVSSETVRARLRAWAKDWCSSDDKCETSS